MGAAEFFKRGPQAGTDGEEAADGRKCGDPAGAPGRNRYTVQRSIRWLSRTAVSGTHNSLRPAPAASTALLGSVTLPQSAPGGREVSASELARKVVTKLKSQDDHGHWMYRLEKEEFGKKQVTEIVEIKDGSLSRLLSIDGHPLTAKQEQKENQRIQKLVSNPDEQRKLQQARSKETEPGRRLFKMLPDAFVFNYAGRVGDLIKLSFRPNPNFQPPSLEARVFHDMEGELWVDGKQERLAVINGHLREDVKFGGGLLGHLDKGGQFAVRQEEVAPGQWDMTVMSIV